MKYLLWQPFIKSEKLKHRQRPFWTSLPPTSMLSWPIPAFAHASYVSNLCLVGEAKLTKLFIWKKVGSLPKVTLPSKRVTLHPGSPCPPSQLCNFSYKQFAAIYKETYEKLSRPGWLGMEGYPTTRDNSPPYKQALTQAPSPPQSGCAGFTDYKKLRTCKEKEKKKHKKKNKLSFQEHFYILLYLFLTLEWLVVLIHR